MTHKPDRDADLHNMVEQSRATPREDYLRPELDSLRGENQEKIDRLLDKIDPLMKDLAER